MSRQTFHYSYHNRSFIERLLALYHAAAKPRAGVVPWDLGKALNSARKRYLKFCGNTSKWMPHQGEREKARRRMGGFSTRHDHTTHETVSAYDTPVYDGVSGERIGAVLGARLIERTRRCPICDAQELSGPRFVFGSGSPEPIPVASGDRRFLCL